VKTLIEGVDEEYLLCIKFQNIWKYKSKVMV